MGSALQWVCVAAVTRAFGLLFPTRCTAAPAPGSNFGAGRRPPDERETGKLGFNGQKRSKISAIALEATGDRYGWGGTLSTAPDTQAAGANLSPISRN